MSNFGHFADFVGNKLSNCNFGNTNCFSYYDFIYLFLSHIYILNCCGTVGNFYCGIKVRGVADNSVDQAEKGNTILKRLLRGFSTNKQTSWDQLLLALEFGYNCHCYQSTRISPFKADFGYNSRIPLDAMVATRLRWSQGGHPEVNFSTYMANILKQLNASLAHIQVLK
jgi:hypothetical protein